MDAPETRYVAVGDSDVAFQVVGQGPDLLYCCGLGTNIELCWEIRPVAEFFTQLASLSRLILFDRRGAGASDAIPNDSFPPWEDWAEDMRAVLDATESERAALVGEGEAGAMAVLFAVTNPHRVRALGLLNTTARYLVADDYPIGFDPDFVDLGVDFIKTNWGKRAMVEYLLGPMADDPEFTRAWLRQISATMTPRTAAAQWRHIVETVDVRGELNLVQAPTVVMHHRNDPNLPISHGQYLAAHIPGARFVEWRGMSDFEMMGDVAEELGLFLTGERRSDHRLVHGHRWVD